METTIGYKVTPMVAQRKIVPEREHLVRTRVRARRNIRSFILLVLAAVVIVLVSLDSSSLRSERNTLTPKNSQEVPNSAPNVATAPTVPKQKGEARKSNIEKTQDDAAALCALADQLRDELNKMNANVFSLDVIQKTEEVEKLVRKIKGEASKRSD